MGSAIQVNDFGEVGHSEEGPSFSVLNGIYGGGRGEQQ